MNNILYVLMVLTLLSCTDKQTPKTPLAHFEHLEAQQLSVSQYLDLDKYEIYKPASVIKQGNNYVVYSQTHENMISYIDIDKGTVTSGIRRGEAPSEIISPGSFQRVGDAYYIYDIARKIIFNVHLEEEISISEYKRLNVAERLFSINVLPSGVVASGLFDNAWVRFYDKDGAYKSSLAFPDFEETDQLTAIEKGAIYISTAMASSPDFSKLVCATPNAGVISFSSIENDKVSEYKRLKYDAPLVKAPRTSGGSAIVFDREGMVGFCELVCEDDVVIALYSGRTFHSHGMLTYHCDHILIYNWEGEPVKHYVLEKPLFSLTYDRENKTIYGIGYDPEGVIIEYDLMMKIN